MCWWYPPEGIVATGVNKAISNVGKPELPLLKNKQIKDFSFETLLIKMEFEGPLICGEADLVCLEVLFNEM